MFATDDSLPPDLTLIFNVKKSALDEAAGVHGDVVHVQTHSLLLALASCTMRHIIELQPRVEGRLEVKVGGGSMMLLLPLRQCKDQHLSRMLPRCTS